ncbi:hypothetical protein VB10N_40330 [Vibrio sp. 10N]|nr:hypothetical protein VB10N_40330 [Vibrio sp. 10N]
MVTTLKNLGRLWQRAMVKQSRIERQYGLTTYCPKNEREFDINALNNEPRIDPPWIEPIE